MNRDLSLPIQPLSLIGNLGIVAGTLLVLVAMLVSLAVM